MAQEKIAKNFIAIALGRVIRRERESRGWSFETLAYLADTKNHTIQSFEKANIIFHSSRAINLFKAFNNGSYAKRFTLEGLTLILSLISTVEMDGKEYLENELKKQPDLALKEKNTIYIKGTLFATGKLTSASPLYEKIFARFYELISDSSDNFYEDMEEFIIKSGLSETLEKYILDPVGFKQDFESNQFNMTYLQFFEDVPSIYYTYLNDVKRAITISTISKEQVLNYEKAQIDKIQDLIIIGKKDVDISVLKFISDFPFVYLPTFNKVSIFGFNDLKIFKQKFQEIVYHHLTNENLQDGETFFKKILLQEFNELEQIASGIWFNKSGITFNIFWMYKVSNSVIPVAFMANVSENGVSAVKVLSLGELRLKIDSLDLVKYLSKETESKPKNFSQVISEAYSFTKENTEDNTDTVTPKVVKVTNTKTKHSP